MAHQGGSDRDRKQRQEHDRAARSYEETTGNPYHLSKGRRTLFAIIALIVVITMTALFVLRVVHW